jgi:3-oxoacyl-[acyl-carrier-protein] synthase III
MRVGDDVALCGAATSLPEGVQTTADAVALGRIDARAAAELGVDRVHVAGTDLIPPEMAVPAARAALAAAGDAPSSVGLLLHCSVWHQGYDLWCAPHYLADRLGLPDALPVSLSQGCNATMAAIELAVPWLAANPPDRTVLVTAADRFPTPGFDRWRGAYGCVYGDAAAAVVLRRGPVRDALALRAISSRALPELEEVNRAGLAPTPAPRMYGGNVDLRAPKKAYFERHGLDEFRKTTAANVRAVLEQSLADAGVAPDDPRLRGIAVPRMGSVTIQDMYASTIAALTPAPVVPMQRLTGHLSCADVLANVADLHAQLLRTPGDIGVVVNVGGGYTWSSLVVEVPAW